MRRMLLLIGLLLLVAGGWALAEAFVISPRPASPLLWGALGAASTTVGVAVLTTVMLMSAVTPPDLEKP